MPQPKSNLVPNPAYAAQPRPVAPTVVRAGPGATTTLINNLQTHDKQFGLETMCVGGGQGMALIIERLS